MELTGVALSGGGIRSATFCLGVLQGLADLGLLKRFDYLSTVSGGGYIGSWLAAWIKREGKIESVEKQLQESRADQAKGRLPGAEAAAGPPPPDVPVDQEPEAIFHLRSHSNYLAPRTRITSIDWWVLVAIYVRNLLLNQLVLIPSLAALLLLPRLGMLLFDWQGGNYAPSCLPRYPFSLCIAGLLAVFSLIVGLSSVVQAFAALTEMGKGQKAVSLARLRYGIVLPLLLSGVSTAWFAWSYVRRPYPTWGLVVGIGGGAALAMFIAILLSLLMSMLFPSKGPKLCDRLKTAGWVLLGMPVGFAAGCLLGLVLQAVYQAVLPHCCPTVADRVWTAAIALTVGPPLGFLAFAIAGIAQCWLGGKSLGEGARELWASLMARMIRAAVAWAGLCAVALFSVPLLIWLGGVVASLLGAGWLSTSIGSVLAGRSPLTGGGKSKPPMELLASVGPYVFVVGLFVILSWAIAACLDNPPSESAAAQFVALKRTPEEPPTRVVLRAETGPTPPGMTTRTREFTEQKDVGKIRRWCYWAGMLPALGSASQSADAGSPTEEPAPKEAWARLLRTYAWVLLVCLAVPRLVSCRAGVNTFSLQGLYANRLVRCYLGASRLKDSEADGQPHGAPPNSGKPPRHPNPITGFDPGDDMPLDALRIGEALPTTAPLPEKALDRPYRGPYLLINTAMNLVQGDELAWQERKAESFILSPLYCGSQSTGYQSTPGGYGAGISLGTAVATSGAAVSPNMGYHSSPAVTALLTVFNVRLGGWFGNPKGKQWDKSDPGSLFRLWDEFLGRTSRGRSYVYLTDGGHFENLGVYELVRRRCRYIVACDAGCDPKYAFTDLGNLIRKCRTDLGVPIEIDVAPINPQGKDRRSPWHCAVGRIGYDSVDPEAQPGILVYLKSSLSGDEPADVLNYAVEHSEFPHQSTLDQFFEESQFESYRALGRHVACGVFGEALYGMEKTETMDDATHRRLAGRLFWDLRVRWFPPPAKQDRASPANRHVELRHVLREDLVRQWPSSEFVALEFLDGNPPEAWTAAWNALTREFLKEYPAEKPCLDAVEGSAANALSKAWLILRGGKNEGRLPVGFAIVWTPTAAGSDYELVYWLCPAYRNLGIGGGNLKELLDMLQEPVRKPTAPPTQLRVRYPHADLPERADEKDKWLALFSRHGFAKAERPAAEGELILETPLEGLTPKPVRRKKKPPNPPAPEQGLP